MEQVDREGEKNHGACKFGEGRTELAGRFHVAAESGFISPSGKLRKVLLCVPCVGCGSPPPFSSLSSGLTM